MTQRSQDQPANERDHRGDHPGEEEFASTSNDDRVARNDSTSNPAPQGGKGTPSQAEGDRDAD